ncbi:hypothetical protein [Roseateles sp. BYS87W]|uniref:Uncharacterized protein n=1 Tax=Pelomonas baiyunensis TaxID=3299026 RepID=A0ABW7H1D8_9BURK
MGLSVARSVVIGLALAAVQTAAGAACLLTAPPAHGTRERDRDAHGLPWHARPVCFRADFGDHGLTLPAEERQSLTHRLEGARRLYRTDCVAVEYGPEWPDLAEARLAYLQRWLSLQGVELRARPRTGGPWSFIDGGSEVELQVVACRFR